MPCADTSATDKLMGCQSAFASRAYPKACSANKSFLISVLLFTSPTELAAVFVAFLEEGTPTGVLFCQEERVQFSRSVTVCFHSFLRFSSCP